MHLVLREGVTARVALVALADPQCVAERPAIDADRAVLGGPGAQYRALRKPKGHRVPVAPGAFDACEGRAPRCRDRPAVDLELRIGTPARYAQEQREGDAPCGGDRQPDGLVEGVVGVLPHPHPYSLSGLSDLGVHLAGGVQGRGEPAVRRAEPQLLAEVRPAHPVVVRATAVLVDAGLVGLHGEAVLELPLGLAVLAEVDAVGARDVVHALSLGIEGSGKEVEGQVLAPVGPDRIAGGAGEQLMTGHELDDAAGLEALPRVGEAGADVLVPREAATGELAVAVQHLLVRAVGGPGQFRVARQLRVLGRLPESLGDVDVVLVGQGARPVGAVGVHLAGEVEQEGVAGAAVQPGGDVESVAPPQRHPAGVEGTASLGVHVAQEAGHERHDAAVTRVLLPGAQGHEQGQEGPEVRTPVECRAQGTGAEEPVRLLGGEDGVDPSACVGERVVVLGGDGERYVSAQPVGQFLPAAVLRVDPAGRGEVEEVRDFLVTAAQPRQLEPQLTGEPAVGGDTARRQPGQRVRRRAPVHGGRIRGFGRRRRGRGDVRGSGRCRGHDQGGVAEEASSGQGHADSPVRVRALVAGRA
ncbi:hypothetical protein RKD48_000148 [Streptomyces ambofaciens]